ncbi:MAG: TraB/GumN family protein [Pseudoxanthomonas sp.]
MRVPLYGMLGLSLLIAHPAAAQEAAPPPETTVVTDEEGVIEMDTVVVAGVQPGPGLWKVRHGDHLMYVLGTQSPLPKNMTWRSDEVTQALQLADEVLGSPGVTVNADVGFFRGLTMLPSALKAAKNPDGEKLEDVLPADLYARWSVLKQRYLGRDGGIEKKRPLIAVYELYGKALSKSGLQGAGSVINPVVDDVLKARRMKRTPTQLKIMLDDPRGALADFRKEGLKPQDLECFRKTLDLIENELPQSTASARAWAVGDWAAIRYTGARWTGTRRLQLGVVRYRHGAQARHARHRGPRARAVDGYRGSFPAKNRITFATISVWDLVRPDGYLAALQAKGYEVEAPE